MSKKLIELSENFKKHSIKFLLGSEIFRNEKIMQELQDFAWLKMGEVYSN